MSLGPENPDMLMVEEPKQREGSAGQVPLNEGLESGCPFEVTKESIPVRLALGC